MPVCLGGLWKVSVHIIDARLTLCENTGSVPMGMLPSGKQSAIDELVAKLIAA